ncbi:MAG: glycoside hydrolase family 5 protein [Defluviitaleaceae bacterium]|nr:glycoside hydrolase family 5 protein [Defluviitaleaceae bacterium]
MTAWEYVGNLGTGWNLGNTLDAIPRADKSPAGQETAWRNPITTPEMIKTVKDAGFDFLRVPVSWCRQIGAAPNYTINEAFFSRVKEVVNYGIFLNIRVILNLHHEDWHFPSDEVYPGAKAQMTAVWTQIAEYFGNYDHRLMFETMNEPRKVRTPVEWGGGDEEGRRVVMQLNQDAVDAIRATAAKFPQNAARKILVPTYAASSYDLAMEDFAIPKDDNNSENIIVSIHSYTPFDFALGEDMTKNRWSSELEGEVDELFARIDKHFLSKKIPVIMGECGARKKHDNEDDRAEWAAYYSKIARKYGVPCALWDNGYMDGPDNAEVFGLLNRQKNEWGFAKIAKAFL